MADMESFRQQVKSEAEDAINDRLGGADPDANPDDPLTPSEIATAGWELSDYNSFFADCRSAGHSASACGDMWSEVKSAGMTDSGGPAPADTDGDPGGSHDDLLLLQQGHEASNIAAQNLGESLMDEDVEAVPVSSDRGQDILESLGDDTSVPAHIRDHGGRVEVGDLEELFREHLLHG